MTIVHVNYNNVVKIVMIDTRIMAILAIE